MQLPERYLDWLADFDRTIDECLEPGMRVLDVGGGRRPTIPIERRPSGVVYVGLDPDPGELNLAGSTAYDEAIVGTIEELDAASIEPFDLVVSWQVFEHVSNLALALDRIGQALNPGGRVIAHFSGRNAIYARLNQIVPHRFARRAMQRLLGREPDTVFRAHYDRCTFRDVSCLLEGWSETRIVCRYAAADYFAWSYPLQRLYLWYEEWALSRPQLATHYLVTARRRPQETIYSERP